MHFRNLSTTTDGPKDDDRPANMLAYGLAGYKVSTGKWRWEHGTPLVVPMFMQSVAMGTRLALLGG